MQDDVVHYAGQPVALVVADSLERAQHAATLLRIAFEQSPSTTTIEQGREHAYEPERIFGGLIPGRSSRGDVEAALAEAAVRIDATYRFAANHHNPIETLAALAAWEDGRLILHDTTQGITATQLTVAALLGLPPGDVRVITQFVGGGFGAKAMVWHQPTLAALAARQVGRPVKLVLTRAQMFSVAGIARSRSSESCWARRATAGLPPFATTSSRSHRRSTTGPSPRSPAPRGPTPARTTRASTDSSAATR